ncbi:hypothetical protein B0H12DRAFT_1236005 [Mycena haematopus]|nr:hypothetical protein B0H12DRAFT_1236005 [Mycena haematopus]
MTTLLSLPSDITINIFTTLIVDLGDAPLVPVVLSLASICKPLRELVIHTPTLWSRICLRVFPRDVKGLELFIHRSKQCLLDVSIYFDSVDLLVPVIIQSYAASRLRRLTLRGSLSSQVKTFLQAIIDTPTPDLADVQLLPREQVECNGNHSPLLSGASDSLRTLTMRGCVSCLAPFPNLTKLNIFQLRCSYEEFRNLIQGSQNLTTLILGELQDHVPETISEDVVSHRALIEAPSVRYFAVGFTNLLFPFPDVQPLLAFISMPNLEYLEVVGSRADYGELSGKPFPALKTLHLRDMNFPDSNAPLYRSFAKITSLELDNIEGVELLTALDENGRPPWPHLQTLRCRFQWEQVNFAWIEKLLEHRPDLTVEVPLENQDEALAICGTHGMRFFSDESTGLISAEDFSRAEWEEEEDWEDSDFSDPTDYIEDDNWDLDQFDDGEYDSDPLGEYDEEYDGFDEAYGGYGDIWG